ncbi:hypothetical protein CVT26_013625 [Gymnopilus dilepis]|uniref:Uncharacterized protein n=1 Tax=Gymnopilus dilepis TaxID=231916 RepID=A0A409Y5W9_9AGAR|nr:hypothetical protein CVT26_013625 [Gymnopilus dilepis]
MELEKQLDEGACNRRPRTLNVNSKGVGTFLIRSDAESRDTRIIATAYDPGDPDLVIDIHKQKKSMKPSLSPRAFC